METDRQTKVISHSSSKGGVDKVTQDGKSYWSPKEPETYMMSVLRLE